ncbi:MAG: FAD:protein FMN transferase [Rubrivivax sp.]|nr:FAD:protein FMN transferase [Rubrivivax sp.]
MDTMLRLGRRRLLGAAGAFGALALVGCTDTRTAPPAAASGQRFSGQTMGSSYTVRLSGTALSPARLEALQADVQDALDAVDHRMSLYRPDSELMRFNRHAAHSPLALSRELMTVLHAGQRVAALTDGAFDITVAPLVLAWGFGPDARRGLPDAQVLQQGRAVMGHGRLRLDLANGLATKGLPGMQADLGGIAKGYGVDRAAQVLESQGATDFMVEVGGEVRTAGHNAQGRPWQIGIEEPDAAPQRARLVVPLSGQAMATSGDYRIYFEEGQRRYSHEIDPRQGEPIAHGLASVTVVAADCMQADALATALIVMGLEPGLALARQQGIAAHFIVRGADGRLVDHATEAFAALRTSATA